MRKNKKENIAAFHTFNILTAAKQLFALKGFEQSTIDDIAKEADYSKRTIYSYFTNKLAMQHTIILDGFTRLAELVGVVQKKEQSFLLSYQELCQTLVNFYLADNYTFISMLNFQNSASDFSETSDELIQSIYIKGEDVNHTLKQILEAGQKDGLIRADIDSVKVGLIFWSALSGVLMLAHHKQYYLEHTFNQSIQSFLDEAFALLLQSVLQK